MKKGWISSPISAKPSFFCEMSNKCLPHLTVINFYPPFFFHKLQVNNLIHIVFFLSFSSVSKSQQQSLEQAARSIGLYVNSDKTDLMCFKQNIVISTLNGKLMILVDKMI